MIILVYLSVGRKDIMKIGYTVFYVFESARLQDKALYRRSLYRLWDCTGGRCTAYFKKDPRTAYSQRALQRASVQTTVSGVPMSLHTLVATQSSALCNPVWAAKLRLAEAAKLPVRKGLRPLWQTELATPVYHSSLRT